MDNSGDKYKAVWVSHSSISDYLNCPRLYYLRNVYKDPKTGRKMTITTPAMALGQAVHDTLESLSTLPIEERLKTPLGERLTASWEKISGKLGGFSSEEEENSYKERAQEMLKNVERNPGLLVNKAIKIKTDFIPNYWLSEEDNIILCGKIDWLEYLEENDSVHIVDFKTGKNIENEKSLQLPIYYLLAKNTQNRGVQKASYWYLSSGELIEKVLPDESQSYEEIIKIATRIKLARALNRFVCVHGGCKHCMPYEQILKGNGERVGVSETNQDIYQVLDVNPSASQVPF